MPRRRQDSLRLIKFKNFLEMQKKLRGKIKMTWVSERLWNLLQKENIPD